MAAGRVDRLSELPDDILRRILHFAPLKEAASTTALSRRWRAPLWLSSGAVNLEAGVLPISGTGSEDLVSATPSGGRRRRRHRNARLFSRSEDVLSVAKGVLDAADVPMTRLTLITWRPHYDHKELVEVLLSHRVTSRVEEVLLVAKDRYHRNLCAVPVDSLPLDTLRILELTYCHGLIYHGEAVLPRLSSLRLSHGVQDLRSLQRVIEAAPALTAIRLESVHIKHEEAIEATWRHLRCPATTVLVLDNCRWEVKTMAAGGVDRLSELPKDILRRILHFAPLKEAASTTALSRRWRESLWLSSGALNLETGVVEKTRKGQRHRNARFFSWPDDLVSAATGALDAADVPLRRLTLITWYPIYDQVEELLLVAKVPNGFPYRRVVVCMVTLDSLQLETLRIIELTSGVIYHGSAVLRRLCSLRLSHCRQYLGSLQRVLDAAPALSVVRLESSLSTAELLEIEATRLRRFSYKGPLHPYSFRPRPLELDHVDLEFFEEGYRVKDRNQDLEAFWRFTRNFTSTKEIRLKVDHLEDIAVLNEARQVDLLPAFGRLERLEVQGAHWTKDKTAALATILNLLHCCPALSVLQINLTAKYEEDDPSNKEGVRKRSTRMEILIAALPGPRYSFQCLQTSLRRVDLQFQLEKKYCFGVKLIKFFAENAMVLEEIRIDRGDENLCEHMKPRVEKWNSSRRELGATSFVVSPLNAMANAPDSTPASQVPVGRAVEMEKKCEKTTACRAKPPPVEHVSSSRKGKKKGGKKGGRKRETR
ncbi:unnamed protein product [Alopecurus aequalis]